VEVNLRVLAPVVGSQGSSGRPCVTPNADSSISFVTVAELEYGARLADWGPTAPAGRCRCQEQGAGHVLQTHHVRVDGLGKAEDLEPAFASLTGISP
jgi:hypothetical protein